MTSRCGEEQSHCSGIRSSLQQRTSIARVFQLEPTRCSECFLSQTTKHVFQSLHHCSPYVPTRCSEIHYRCSECSRFLSISTMKPQPFLNEINTPHVMLCCRHKIALTLSLEVFFFCSWNAPHLGYNWWVLYQFSTIRFIYQYQCNIIFNTLDFISSY